MTVRILKSSLRANPLNHRQAATGFLYYSVSVHCKHFIGRTPLRKAESGYKDTEFTTFNPNFSEGIFRKISHQQLKHIHATSPGKRLQR